jgi:inosose dehydratase
MTINRRTFLAMPALAAAKPAYAPKIGVQCYVFTQLKQTPEEFFATAARAGYQRVALVPAMMPDNLGELLRKNNLECPIVYSGTTLHEEAAAEKSMAVALKVADAGKRAGASVLVVNPDPKRGRERKTDAEIKLQAGNLNLLGEECKKRGMRLAVHNHDPELKEDAREWRSDMAYTNPKLVGICADVHWFFRGGHDPLVMLREAGTRIIDMHLRNSKNKVWTESLGDGDVDYRAVAAYARKIGYSGYLTVELAYEKGTEPKQSIEQNIRQSRLYTEEVFLR